MAWSHCSGGGRIRAKRDQPQCWTSVNQELVAQERSETSAHTPRREVGPNGHDVGARERPEKIAVLLVELSERGRLLPARHGLRRGGGLPAQSLRRPGAVSARGGQTAPVFGMTLPRFRDDFSGARDKKNFARVGRSEPAPGGRLPTAPAKVH